MSRLVLGVKRIIACISVTAVFIFSWKILRFLLNDDTTSYTRIALHEFYEQDEIDTVFIGASHCYRSFVPSVFNEKTGLQSFNLGSSNQQIDLSFLLMQEAVETYNIKNVIVEVSFNIATCGIVKEDKLGIWNAWLMTDYMRPSIRKYMYLFNASDPTQYANSMFVAKRNWKDLFIPQNIKATLEKKLSATYKNYAHDFVAYKDEQYVGNGYVAGEIKITDHTFFSPTGYTPISCADIGEEWENVINKMIRYCNEKGIKLTFVSTPVSSFLNAGRTNYDEYIDYMNFLIEGTDVKYLDFNLMKETYWADTSEYFMDDNHLNKYGAKLLSEIYSNVLNGSIAEDDLFYTSMDEKFMNLDPVVYGISYYDSTEGDECIRRCKIVSNYKKDLLYKITLISEEGKEIEIQDYSDNIYFMLSPEEHGVCLISTKNMSNNDEIISIVKIAY